MTMCLLLPTWYDDLLLLLSITRLAELKCTAPHLRPPTRLSEMLPTASIAGHANASALAGEGSSGPGLVTPVGEEFRPEVRDVHLTTPSKPTELANLQSYQ